MGSEEDLLRRPTSTEHGSEVANVFPGKVVLITGAGGSIGSELARQVVALRPSRLILLDRAESALFDIHRQLAENLTTSGVELRAELANVASRAAVHRIIEREREALLALRRGRLLGDDVLQKLIRELDLAEIVISRG